MEEIYRVNKFALKWNNYLEVFFLCGSGKADNSEGLFEETEEFLS